MQPRRIITLTTDFGLVDAYVGIMKGVILSIAPNTVIVDIVHEIGPQNVSEGAYVLKTAYRYFPADTIHIGVVDPGVGTARRAIAVQAAHGLFVGPDNGLFSVALADQGAFKGESGALVEAAAVELTNQRYWRHPVSRTFHGRDIFAPAAAHLAAGAALSEMGPALEVIERPFKETATGRGGEVHGAIVHIDRFGNAVSNIPIALVPANSAFVVGGRTLRGLAGSYQEAPLVAIAGSAGVVEIAARNASAAETLGLRVGDELIVRSAT